jgi:hypothetical protein
MTLLTATVTLLTDLNRTNVSTAATPISINEYTYTLVTRHTKTVDLSHLACQDKTYVMKNR